MSDRVPAQTIGELDLHLGYVRDALTDLQKAVGQMATKRDIEDLEKRLQLYATTQYVDEAVKRAVPSFAKRVGSALLMTVAVGAAVGAVFGVLVTLVHWFDKLPK